MSTRAIDSFLEETKDGKIVNKASKMTIYLPVSYFDTELSKWLGGEVSSIGSFYVGFKLTPDSEEKIMRMDLAVSIRFNYTDQVKITTKLDGSKEDTYYALSLGKDEIFMNSTTHLVSLEDAKAFLSYLNQGKLPNDIPYSKLINMIKFNMYTNDMGIPIPSALLELMVGEMCRYQKDLAVPFRRIAGRNNNQTDYEMLNIKSLPRLNSVFAGLAFEDINESIISGINITKEGRPQNISHTEKIIYS